MLNLRIKAEVMNVFVTMVALFPYTLYSVDCFIDPHQEVFRLDVSVDEVDGVQEVEACDHLAWCVHYPTQSRCEVTDTVRASFSRGAISWST